MVPRLLERYRKEIAPKLSDELGLKNVHQVPNLKKIVVNIGLGEAAANPKLLDKAAEELAAITGQKPSIRRARKSVANFKLREGMAVGCKVTLRQSRMYEFIDRLVTIALPRVRDFRGVSAKQFDGRGNYALGLKEQIVFPEINYDDVDEVRGMDIVICTTAPNDDEARALLEGFQMPFNN